MDDVQGFRARLMRWYTLHARALPWRGIDDPYRTWVSEVMLQQTRVAAVLDHYERFLVRFPTLEALAGASEAEVLAAWSGLGYYRRARMMHKAGHFVMRELGGSIPATAAELRKLPGIGAYTAAAIASIAFGESVAVLDGNVERVLLRLAGRAEETTAAGRGWLRAEAAALVPPAGGEGNAPGDHNQAMMELGATVCLPRAPLCLHCPVYEFCLTRGEHATTPRAKPAVRDVAYVVATRTRRGRTEVLLDRRPADASLMPDMYELPSVLLDEVAGQTPLLAVRHAITTTLYRVRIYSGKRMTSQPPRQWTPVSALGELPLTGLTRKVCRRLRLMPIG